eukprot:s2181_g5.t1
MATMDREAFAEYLDSSWVDFRQRLLAVYPEGSFASISAASGGSSGFYDHPRGGMLGNSSSSDYDPSAGSYGSRVYSDEDDENEHGGAHDPESNELLAGALADRSKEQVEAARNRLRLRLGATSSNKLVSGKRLLEAVQNGFVNQLADWINLTFEGDKTKHSKNGRKSKRRSTFDNSINLGLFTLGGMHTTETKKLGKPKWSYPQDAGKASWGYKGGASGPWRPLWQDQSIVRNGRSSLGSKSATAHVFETHEERCHYNVVPAQPLVDVFLATEEEAMKKVFGSAHFKQYQAMREILLAGDTNRLVAELTFVRINDLAAPPEPVHPLTYIEPVVALLIVANGVMIGFQSDPGYENWPGWPFLELGFACLLILEVLLRVYWLKCARYWCGADRLWNWFDLFLVAVGISDFCLQLFGSDASIQHASLLRFCRLIRLVRIVKVFRIRIMRDLRLMVKGLRDLRLSGGIYYTIGLIAGIRTLFLAFILLFAVLYVMSGFATLTIGNSETADAWRAVVATLDKAWQDGTALGRVVHMAPGFPLVRLGAVLGMSTDRLSPWRRTGRKANEEHFQGLAPMALVEFPGYDNRGGQQGKILACLSNEEEVSEGKLFMGHVLAVEDGYYDYWVGTRYRDPIHVDVFRVVKLEQLEKLQWLSDEHWGHIRANPLVISLGADLGVGGDPPAPVATPKAGAKKEKPGEVQSGQPGIAGLAQALGAGAPAGRQVEGEEVGSATSEEEQKRKKKKERKDRRGKKRPAGDFVADEGDLREAINKRAPKEPRLSPLDLTSLNKVEKKKKKRRKGKDKSDDDDRRSGSPSSSSSTGSLFPSAALPKGLERLRRVHQKYPGKIASLTLLRMKELVAMTQGRGTAEESENPLPAVATPYLIQVLFSKYPAGEVPMRTMRELRTVAALRGEQRPSEGSGRAGSEIQSLGTRPRAAELGTGQPVGADPQRSDLSSLPPGGQSSSSRGEVELATRSRSPAPSKVATTAAVDRGSAGRDKRPKRGLPKPVRRQAPTEHGTTKGQGERQEGQGQASMVSSALTLLPTLQAALQGKDIRERTKQRIQGMANDPRLCQTIEAVLGCYDNDADKAEIRRDLADVLVDQFEKDGTHVNEAILKKYEPLWQEGGPEGDEHFEAVLPSRYRASSRRPLPRMSRPRQGNLLQTHKGCEIREWYDGWDASDGGVYVGKGNGQMTCSIFQESYKDSLDPVAVGRALDGRALYVFAGEVDLAVELIDKFGIAGRQDVMLEQGCEEMLRASLKDCASVSLTRGGAESFAGAPPWQVPVEILPISLPEDTHDEKQSLRLLARYVQSAASEKDELYKNMESCAHAAGEASWTWIIIAMINFLFCGGGRPLGKVMLHPERHSAEQENIVSEFRRLVRIWIQEDAHSIEVADWEHHAQTLGDMYTGYEVKKAYQLSWKAIKPHVPQEGEAGRISLAETVRPELKDYVQNPDLLRIPDDELGDIPMSAPVLVESDSEFDLIVHHLVRAGMFEKEVPSETLTVKGEPVYNGLFGVHKAWKVDENGQTYRTLRLIVNLIPSNSCQRRMPLQPSRKMGYAPLWGSMCLLEDEVILSYAEDVRHCFHIFSPSERWRGYFVLSKKASSQAFGDAAGGAPCRPRVKSAPMGWSNIVDFVQSTLEEMGRLSGVPAERVVKLGEPSPLMPLGEKREYHSFYVDNYDSFCVIAQTDLGSYMGKPSDSQLKLRETFKVWGIGRDEHKAAEGVLEWQTLGAEQLGEAGLVGSARKFRRAVLGSSLHLLGKASRVFCKDLELSSLVGKHMHSIQFCRPLGCCMDELYGSMNHSQRGSTLQTPAIEELYLLCGLLPLHWLDQRSKLNPTVYATDASLDGGGACASTQLSVRGRAKCHLLCTESDGLEGGAADSLLVIEAFGGIGGLRKALELIGVLPQGIILIDCDPVCAKLAKRHCAYDSGGQHQKGDQGDGQAMESSARLGVAADSSLLVDDMVNIGKWLKECSLPLKLPEWEVTELYENVVMDPDDLQVKSAKIGTGPIMNEAADVLWCRRPRLYWLKNLPLIMGIDAKILENQDVGPSGIKLPVLKLDCQKPPLSTFLRKHCSKLSQPEEPFFCFARPHPRAEPPAAPAGIDRCSQKALGRWKGDGYRLAPYQYQDNNLVKGADGPRRLLSDEQLRMLGFNTDHLELKQKLSEDQRGQLVGNTFPVVVVARLLCGLALTEEQAKGRNLCNEIWQIWATLEARVSQLKATGWAAKFGMSAGADVGQFRLRTSESGIDPQLARGILDPTDALTDEQLLVYLITRATSHRGTDCKVDAGIPYSASDFCRRSVDPTLWEWKVLMSYKWKSTGHINALEAIAILDLLRKLGRNKSNHFQRTLLLVDNTTVVGILAKGRTTSTTLRGPLRRATAVLVATGTRLVVAWVKSEWNPADGPSRWVQRRAVRDA